MDETARRGHHAAMTTGAALPAATPHPMDAIPVRRLKFAVGADAPIVPLWSRTDPRFSLFLNALGLHVPHFERYLCRALSRARPAITDPRLAADVDAIIGQEAQHARTFLKVNTALAAHYPEVAALEARAAAFFARRTKEDSLRLAVGFTAGYETFTFLAGLIILDNHDRWFADADPVMKAIWVWHQVEEVEHGAVAFEVWQHLYPGQEAYRRWMIIAALSHIARETLVTYAHMARIEGWMRNPLAAARTMGFCVEMLGRLLWRALPVFGRRYHPRAHPLVTSAQNPIQVAWRRHFGAGGDVLSLDRAAMARIMAIPADPHAA